VINKLIITFIISFILLLVSIKCISTEFDPPLWFKATLVIPLIISFLGIFVCILVSVWL
jgi:uncharacterized membrane protein